MVAIQSTVSVSLIACGQCVVRVDWHHVSIGFGRRRRLRNFLFHCSFGHLLTYYTGLWVGHILSRQQLDWAESRPVFRPWPPRRQSELLVWNGCWASRCNGASYRRKLVRALTVRELVCPRGVQLPFGICQIISHVRGSLGRSCNFAAGRVPSIAIRVSICLFVSLFIYL